MGLGAFGNQLEPLDLNYLPVTTPHIASKTARYPIQLIKRHNMSAVKEGDFNGTSRISAFDAIGIRADRE